MHIHAVEFLVLLSPLIIPAQSRNVLVGSISFCASRSRRATAFAGVVVPGQTVFAAQRQAGTQASFGVEEETFSAFSEVDAWLAKTAVRIPNGSTWARVVNNRNCVALSILDVLVNRRDTLAVASASYITPDVTFRACLSVAGALALLCIPVELVVLACLRLANVAA